MNNFVNRKKTTIAVPQIPTKGSNSLRASRYYYNNNWQVLAETDYDSTGPTETQLRDYIYGNYIDEVLIMTDDSDAKHYYPITFDFVICHPRENPTRTEAKSRDSESISRPVPPVIPAKAGIQYFDVKTYEPVLTQ